MSINKVLDSFLVDPAGVTKRLKILTGIKGDEAQ